MAGGTKGDGATVGVSVVMDLEGDGVNGDGSIVGVMLGRGVSLGVVVGGQHLTSVGTGTGVVVVVGDGLIDAVGRLLTVDNSSGAVSIEPISQTTANVAKNRITPLMFMVTF
jgi:hypothetical protein